MVGTYLCTAWEGRVALYRQLTVALHGLLGCQDERCETGEGLCQLQERMLHKDKRKKKNSELCVDLIKTQKTFSEKTLRGLKSCITCSSSLPPPRFSTSISKQRLRKSLKTGDSFSGFWSSGVPFVAIRYNACQRGRDDRKGNIRNCQTKFQETTHLQQLNQV